MNQKYFALICVVLMNMLGFMSTDIHLPALCTIQKDLETSILGAQSIFIVAVAVSTISPLMWGPLSDRLGRRPAILWASVLMIVGQIACAVAINIEQMICFRIIQYIGTGAVLTFAVATICDLYSGVRRTQMLGFLEMSIPIGLMIAPILGGYIVTFAHWRVNFVILSVLDLIVLVVFYFFAPETKLPESQQPQETASFRTQVRAVIKDSVFMRYAFIYSLVNAVFFIFISNFHLILPQHGVTPTQSGIYQATFSVAYLVGLLVNHQRLHTIASTRLLNWGMWGFFVYGCLMLLMALGIIKPTPMNTLYVMILNSLIAGPILTCSMSMALAHYKFSYGTASAVIEFLMGTLSAFLMIICNMLPGSISTRMNTTICFCALTAVALYAFTCMGQRQQNAPS